MKLTTKLLISTCLYAFVFTPRNFSAMEINDPLALALGVPVRSTSTRDILLGSLEPVSGRSALILTFSNPRALYDYSNGILSTATNMIRKTGIDKKKDCEAIIASLHPNDASLSIQSTTGNIHQVTVDDLERVMYNLTMAQVQAYTSLAEIEGVLSDKGRDYFKQAFELTFSYIQGIGSCDPYKSKLDFVQERIRLHNYLICGHLGIFMSHLTHDLMVLLRKEFSDLNSQNALENINKSICMLKKSVFALEPKDTFDSKLEFRPKILNIIVQEAMYAVQILNNHNNDYVSIAYEAIDKLKLLKQKNIKESNHYLETSGRIIEATNSLVLSVSQFKQPQDLLNTKLSDVRDSQKALSFLKNAFHEREKLNSLINIPLNDSDLILQQGVLLNQKLQLELTKYFLKNKKSIVKKSGKKTNKSNNSLALLVTSGSLSESSTDFTLISNILDFEHAIAGWDIIKKESPEELGNDPETKTIVSQPLTVSQELASSNADMSEAIYKKYANEYGINNTVQMSLWHISYLLIASETQLAFERACALTEMLKEQEDSRYEAIRFIAAKLEMKLDKEIEVSRQKAIQDAEKVKKEVLKKEKDEKKAAKNAERFERLRREEEERRKASQQQAIQRKEEQRLERERRQAAEKVGKDSALSVTVTASQILVNSETEKQAQLKRHQEAEKLRAQEREAKNSEEKRIREEKRPAAEQRDAAKKEKAERKEKAKAEMKVQNKTASVDAISGVDSNLEKSHTMSEVSSFLIKDDAIPLHEKTSMPFSAEIPIDILTLEAEVNDTLDEVSCFEKALSPTEILLPPPGLEHIKPSKVPGSWAVQSYAGAPTLSDSHGRQQVSQLFDSDQDELVEMMMRSLGL